MGCTRTAVASTVSTYGKASGMTPLRGMLARKRRYCAVEHLRTMMRWMQPSAMWAKGARPWSSEKRRDQLR